jgi:hypothetical protein
MQMVINIQVFIIIYFSEIFQPHLVYSFFYVSCLSDPWLYHTSNIKQIVQTTKCLIK